MPAGIHECAHGVVVAADEEQRDVARLMREVAARRRRIGRESDQQRLLPEQRIDLAAELLTAEIVLCRHAQTVIGEIGGAVLQMRCGTVE